MVREVLSAFIGMRPTPLIVAGLLAAGTLQAQTIKLVATTDSTHYRIGEWINLKVTADLPDGVESIGPVVADTLGPFEVLGIDTMDQEVADGKVLRAWLIRLTCFEAGQFVVPPMEFTYTMRNERTEQAVSTNPVPLSIAGVTVDPKGDIKDVKPPLSAPWEFEDYLPYGIAVLVAALLWAAYSYYQRYKRRTVYSKEPVIRIPPHEAALTALRELEDKKLWQQGKLKEYYSEVTEIIRRFFEGRWQIVALEATSDEILQQLKGTAEADAMWKELNTFFLTADLVKFARYEPAPKEHEQELRWAYEIVRAMIPRPVGEEKAEEVGTDAR